MQRLPMILAAMRHLSLAQLAMRVGRDDASPARFYYDLHAHERGSYVAFNTAIAIDSMRCRVLIKRVAASWFELPLSSAAKRRLFWRKAKSIYFLIDDSAQCRVSSFHRFLARVHYCGRKRQWA